MKRFTSIPKAAGVLLCSLMYMHCNPSPDTLRSDLASEDSAVVASRNLNSTMMCGEFITTDEMNGIKAAVSQELSRFDSIETLGEWLRSHACVDAIDVADKLVKTLPPQKEIILSLKTENGEIIKKVLDVAINPDYSMEVIDLHDL